MNGLDILFQKSTVEIMFIIMVITFAIIFLLFILFLLIKLFKINISFKNFKLFSRNKNLFTETVMDNFLIKLSMLHQKTNADLKRLNEEKYLLKYKKERKQQMAYCQRIFETILGKVRTGFYSLKKNYRIDHGMSEKEAKKNLNDQNIQNFNTALGELRYELRSYFRNLFEENGLENLDTDSSSTKNSELEDYIKSQQYNIKDFIMKFLNGRCSMLTEPDWIVTYDYIKDNFFDEIDKTIERCILNGRKVHIEILKKIKEKDVEIDEILNSNIRQIMEKEINILLNKKDTI